MRVHPLLVQGAHLHNLLWEIFISKPFDGVMELCSLLMAILTFQDLHPGMLYNFLAKLLDPGWREGPVGNSREQTLFLELSICPGRKYNYVVVAVHWVFLITSNFLAWLEITIYVKKLVFKK